MRTRGRLWRSVGGRRRCGREEDAVREPCSVARVEINSGARSVIDGGFSISGQHGWHGIGLGVLGNAVFLISGWQDYHRDRSWLPSGFWFFLAGIAMVGVIWLAFQEGIWGGVAFGVGVLFLEIWFIRRVVIGSSAAVPSSHIRG
jgi:hypothetical protein